VNRTKKILKWLLFRGGAFFLYSSGALSLFHRLRNRDVLTVAMFHRVLSQKDPRWETLLPDWTISEGVFWDCLSFFQRHYTIVSPADLTAALHGRQPLPSRSLLLTFDDGYADNEEYALPILRRLHLPAALFITSGFIDRKDRPWTEEFSWAYRNGKITREVVAAVHRLIPIDVPRLPEDTAGMVEDIMRRGPQLRDSDVEVALPQLGTLLRRPNSRSQMLSRKQVRALSNQGIAIGAHGKTHVALRFATDLGAELQQPRQVLKELLACRPQQIFDALALPYGDGTPEIIDRAIREGYQFVFTTRPELTPLNSGFLHACEIGRINVSGPILAPDGRFRPELAALEFFRLPFAKIPKRKN
jgi:peptidoglycan/xylan/chitin deacetylase (PgdA/CDA1 family)